MKKLTNDQRQEIIAKYLTGNFTLASLGREYNVDYQYIQRILNKNNIKICNDFSYLARKYNLNQNYFDVIDNENKAYFLGLLYADGCNYEKGTNISISLIDKDKDLLEKFAQELQSNRPLVFQELSKKNKNWNNVYTLSVNGKYLSKRLAELGCVARKSLILDFPTLEQVPANLIHHFMRGYSDGDGCITYGIKQYSYSVKWSIISTDKFCYKVHDLLKSIFNFDGFIYNNSDTQNITKCLDYSGFSKCLPILNWLYKDANIYMKRKYVKYLEILDIDKIRMKVPSRIKDIKTGKFVKRIYHEENSS